METALKRIALYSAAVTREDCENRLQRIRDKGLSNCQNAKDLQWKIESFDYAEIQTRYNEKYPKYLFFHQGEFDEIVKRNHLIVSTIDNFTGFIPEHCLEDILNENVDEDDHRPVKYIIKNDQNRIILETEDIGYLQVLRTDLIKTKKIYCFERQDYHQLYIAAPAEDLRIPASDPIVFRYVKGGILVITFWR
ncbi:MAG: hypothetical protein LBG17_10215 [Bacteroidales bacterium]|jgi:hypothetical protein|nr:hypothetical protein [Bacteroidales bacterium]